MIGLLITIAIVVLIELIHLKFQIDEKNGKEIKGIPKFIAENQLFLMCFMSTMLFLGIIIFAIIDGAPKLAIEGFVGFFLLGAILSFIFRPRK